MDIFKKRFAELTSQADALEKTQKPGRDSFTGAIENDVDYNSLLNWRVKSKSLLERACGRESQYYSEFEEAEKGTFGNSLYVLKRLEQIFAAAREDYEGGYLTSLRALVQAEVFDSELEQARELLRTGYSVPAAVVAGIVIETSIRNLCTQKGCGTGKLDKMNADLVKAGAYNSVMQKRVTHLAAVRNSAAHGKKDEFERYDVSAMIDEVEQFVARFVS